MHVRPAFNIILVLEECFEGVVMVFQFVSRVLHGCFKGGKLVFLFTGFFAVGVSALQFIFRAFSRISSSALLAPP